MTSAPTVGEDRMFDPDAGRSVQRDQERESMKSVAFARDILGPVDPDRFAAAVADMPTPVPANA
jgi:hypothetical protein